MNPGPVETSGQDSVPGIDEFSVHKGHRYFTVIIDPESRRPVWIGQGRSQQVVEPLFKVLKRQGIHPLAVAMDMWNAYTKSLMEHFPMAAIVYDRLHIITNANKVLNEIRRLLRRTETGSARHQAPQAHAPDSLKKAGKN